MPLPALTLLVPQSRPVPPDDAEADLLALYAHAPGVVRANMIASVDGGAWGPDHVSGSINDAADWRVFRVLRALADVVVVGAGTARAEQYTQLGRPDGLEHLREAPLELALVTRSGDVPPVLAQAERPPFVITGARGAAAAHAALPPERVIVVPTAGDTSDAAGPHAGAAPPHASDVDVAAGLAALAEHGLARVLCEGGPHLLADLLAAGRVDELCVTTAPLLVGPGASRIVAGEAPAATPPQARLGHLLHAPGTGTLLARWLVPRA
ncbi:dihydrofolate reductase family protein [Xylanimonas protaetiae]|uniref:Deaminase n=1 Tax=Xylanimonas protaetiae TaxID=2509457 RepID=A0A4P6F8J8_9MICO|nr:dihydrofolate reductase family protein [Xylanimonas protaetiae]QAY71213.1 deaminase [Xylanimonas protaetiae]